MIAALRSPIRRLIFAIALSVIMHAAILGLPHLHLPHEKLQLPPLTARIEFLPPPVAQPATKPAPVTQAGKPEGGTLGKADAGIPSKPGGNTPVKQGDSTPAKPTSNTAKTMREMEKSATIRQFPKHLKLTFSVYRGADLSMVGELHQQLDIDGDRYTLQATKQITGLANLLNNDQTIQTSHGKIGEHGLQPDTFKEERITRSGKQGLETTFDWAAQKLHLSNGGDTALPSDAQDILSFMYQLSQLSMQTEMIPLSISNGTRLESNQIEIGVTEDISTPMGTLHTLHLRKVHNQGEAYFEIWLGLEYRLLPVKFRQVNRADIVTEEFVLSDIRAADE